MTKRICFLLGIVLITSCGGREPRVEKVFEDGVEVIHNHLDPYPLESEPTDFKLEEELEIDFGGPEIGELGIADATDFAVDRKGQIYIFCSHKQGDKIFKFGPDGKFLKSWGAHGQGPGEVMFISSACLTAQGHLLVSDHPGKKIIWYSDEGELEREVRYPVDGRYYIIYPINEERSVGYARVGTDASADYFESAFYLLDDAFGELRKLDSFRYPNPRTKPRRGINHNYFFSAKAWPGGVYVGNEDRGYEILKFDLQGNLRLKIRKEYVPVKVPEEVIKRRKDYYAKSGQPAYFPEHYLPVCDFFSDEDGRLFSMTFEKGVQPGEYWYDVFNAGGVLIRRKSLPILTPGEDFAYAEMKRGRLYCFQDRGDGFNVFKVYRLLWE
ncbi:MAG: 6-bladed beta-propeller [Candidatus Aminicenantes bacterium]|nr:6-bladed beta-propeller [Candidatus Aminicenantes bacterium]